MEDEHEGAEFYSAFQPDVGTAQARRQGHFLQAAESNRRPFVKQAVKGAKS
jgi:hypothetical protein